MERRNMIDQLINRSIDYYKTNSLDYTHSKEVSKAYISMVAGELERLTDEELESRLNKSIKKS